MVTQQLGLGNRDVGRGTGYIGHWQDGDLVADRRMTRLLASLFQATLYEGLNGRQD